MSCTCHASYTSHTSHHNLPSFVLDVYFLPLANPSTALLQSEYIVTSLMWGCSFRLARHCCIVFNSALGTVCNPPSEPLSPYKAFLLDPLWGTTQAQPHLRSLLSLVRLPPDPSVNIVTFFSQYVFISPRLSEFSIIWS